MSIARALTRRGRGASNEELTPSAPVRAGTLRKSDYRMVDRAKISLPTALLSTTNALAYDAPDLPRVQTIMSPSTSSTSSRRSYEGSESGASSATSISTPSFSREGSPVLDANQSSYFQHSPKKTFIDSLPIQTPLSASFQEIEIPPTTPAVPNRALSHTMKNHQALARKRSHTRLSGENQTSLNSRSASGEGLTTYMDDHPFGAELAQVMEVAEEFGVGKGVSTRIWDEEEQFLMDNGYGRFSAEDYMSEIQPLFGKAFHNTPFISNVPMWL